MSTDIEPRITSMRMWTSVVRKKPKTGDYRVTKKHGEQIRVPEMVRIPGGGMAFNCTGGRLQFVWVTRDKTPELYALCWDRIDRAAAEIGRTL